MRISGAAFVGHYLSLCQDQVTPIHPKFLHIPTIYKVSQKMVTTPVKYIRNGKIWGVLENSAYMNILHDMHQTFKNGEMNEEIVKLMQGSGKDRQRIVKGERS